jgi:hypothetical protein
LRSLLQIRAPIIDLFDIHNISLTISTPVLSWGDMTLVRSTELFPYPFGVFPLLLSMTPRWSGIAGRTHDSLEFRADVVAPKPIWVVSHL